MRASHQRKLIVLNPQANTSGAAATAASRLATPPYPIAAAEYAIAGAWSPANAIEEHLVRKIGALGVTIENLLNHLSLLDPADPVKARIISSFSLTLTRLQKTQSTLEAELREVQAQRGIRATHPITCEKIPSQADALPYVFESGNSFNYKQCELIVAPEEMPDTARQLLETHFGTRIYKPSERQNGKFMITPKLIDEIAAKLRPDQASRPSHLRPSAANWFSASAQGAWRSVVRDLGKRTGHVALRCARSREA
jgi:hypothetical protein